MRRCVTYKAEIYCGLRVGYTDEAHTLEAAEKVVQAFVDRAKARNRIGVSLLPNVIVYPGGAEHGVVAGLINYPVYPLGACELRKVALALASDLRYHLEQERVTILLFGGELGEGMSESITLEKGDPHYHYELAKPAPAKEKPDG